MLLTPFELRDVGERSAGLPTGTLTWAGPFDPATDEPWQVWQSGGMTEREYWQLRCEEFSVLTGAEPTMPAFLAHLYSAPPDRMIRQGAVSLIADAKRAGIPVGLLTNDLRSFHDKEWLEQMTILQEFEFIVEGKTDGVLKPDPAAYELILSRMGVTAGESVFIDDQPGNLTGAEAVGMRTVHLDPVHPDRGFASARGLLGLN